MLAKGQLHQLGRSTAQFCVKMAMHGESMDRKRQWIPNTSGIFSIVSFQLLNYSALVFHICKYIDILFGHIVYKHIDQRMWI